MNQETICSERIFVRAQRSKCRNLKLRALLRQKCHGKHKQTLIQTNNVPFRFIHLTGWRVGRGWGEGGGGGGRPGEVSGMAANPSSYRHSSIQRAPLNLVLPNALETETFNKLKTNDPPRYRKQLMANCSTPRLSRCSIYAGYEGLVGSVG